MTKDTYLTGITTTGTPHIGNYVGAIQPGIIASRDLGTRHFYFLADYHSLAKNEDPGQDQPVDARDRGGLAGARTGHRSMRTSIGSPTSRRYRS